MRREWEPVELVACWTLVDADWELIANKSGTTRLGFAVMLKFFEIDGRFPRSNNQVPAAAVVYVANQLHLAPGEFAAYSLSGRTVEYHRAQIRSAFGFRAFSASDEDKLADSMVQRLEALLSPEEGDGTERATLAEVKADPALRGAGSGSRPAGWAGRPRSPTRCAGRQPGIGVYPRVQGLSVDAARRDQLGLQWLKMHDEHENEQGLSGEDADAQAVVAADPPV